jgi:hypothetical protein
MPLLRPLVSIVTAVAFFVQATGLAYAAPPGDVQPVPYSPSQPVPLPAAPPSPPGAAPPPPAFAPARPGGDTIYLKDGGMVRGTLVEMLPNDHATIQLPTGQSAVVAWGRIDRIEQATLQVAPMAPQVEVGARRHHAKEGATAFVHIDADTSIVLESLSDRGGWPYWSRVCTAPCDAELPLGREYRLAGPDIRNSRPFGLMANPGQHVVLRVSGGSRGAFAGGIVLSSVGAAAIGVGLVVLLFGAIGTCTGTDEFGDCTATQSNTGLETAGAIITLAGVGLVIGGIILTVSNARSHETQLVSELFRAPPPRPETAWLRAPVWHDTAKDPAASPKPFGLPLFTQRF